MEVSWVPGRWQPRHGPSQSQRVGHHTWWYEIGRVYRRAIASTCRRWGMERWRHWTGHDSRPLHREVPLEPLRVRDYLTNGRSTWAKDSFLLLCFTRKHPSTGAHHCFASQDSRIGVGPHTDGGGLRRGTQDETGRGRLSPSQTQTHRLSGQTGKGRFDVVRLHVTFRCRGRRSRR